MLGLHREYRLPPVWITENGMPCDDRAAKRPPSADAARIDYVRRHLEALAAARKAEGVDIRGYFYWSLMDNFEWDSGYAKRFGLVHVDYATQAANAEGQRPLVSADARFAGGPAMAELSAARGLRKSFGDGRRSCKSLDLDVRRRRVHGLRRPLGLRQDRRCCA